MKQDTLPLRDTIESDLKHDGMQRIESWGGVLYCTTEGAPHIPAPQTADEYSAWITHRLSVTSVPLPVDEFIRALTMATLSDLNRGRDLDRVKPTTNKKAR